MRHGSRFFGVFLLLLPAAPLGAASLAGTVTYGGGDQEGRPAPDALVQLEPSAPGHPARRTTTDSRGRFQFLGVEAGSWVLLATATGYETARILSFQLTGGSRESGIRLRLVPAEVVVAEIQVRGQKEGTVPEFLIPGERSVVDRDTVQQLPLINRRIQDVLKHFAGVSSTGGRESDELSIDGGTAAQVGYNLDGVNFTDILSGGSAGGIADNAVSEYELTRSGYQAEYGGVSTAIVNILTRSGSNTVEFDLQSSLREVEAAGSRLAELDRVQETWHRLLNAEAFPEARGLLQRGLGRLPSRRADDRNPPGRGRWEHQLGVGGPILMDRVHFYANLQVLSDDFGSPFSDDRRTEDTLGFFSKVTWNRDEARKVWGEINVEQEDGAGFTDPRRTAATSTEDSRGNWLLALRTRNVLGKGFWGKGSWSDALFESSLAWTHQYETSRPSDPDADRQVNLFLPPAGVIALSTRGPALEQDLTVDQLRATASLTNRFGSHLLKAGGEFGLQRLQGTQGRFPLYNDFRLLFTGGFGGTTGALPGSLGQFIDPGPARSLDASAKLASAYIQDEWTLTRRLTLFPGVRAEWQDFVGKVLVSPRFSFILDPVGNQKTRIQGSWGRAYQNLFLEALAWDLRPDQRIYEVLSGTDASAQTVGFDVIGLDDLVEATRRFEDGVSTLGRLFPRQIQTFDIDRDLSSPRNDQWNLRLDRALPAGLNLSLSYTEAERRNSLTQRVNVLDSGAALNDPDRVQILFSSRGRVEVKAWTVGLSKAFSDGWLFNASYTQQRVLGPTVQVADPLDPLRIQSTFGPLARERREVAQLSSSVHLPWKLQLGVSFRYQSGTPITPTAYDAQLVDISDSPGAPVLITQAVSRQPLGVNSVRLPPERNLDLVLSRRFKTGSDATLEARLSLFNVTNETNVLAALATFGDLTDAQPLDDQPLRPGILPLTVDVPRTAQVELRFSF